MPFELDETFESGVNIKVVGVGEKTVDYSGKRVKVSM